MKVSLHDEQSSEVPGKQVLQIAEHLTHSVGTTYVFGASHSHSLPLRVKFAAHLVQLSAVPVQNSHGRLQSEHYVPSSN
jgi:hypothetical protein